MAANVVLHMLYDDSYHPVLSIPANACLRFSTHPLTWLRYVAYTIYGGEGFIFTSAGGEEIQDYHAPLKDENYHSISNGEPLWLDPLGMDDRTSTAGSDISDSSTLTDARAAFRDRVLARDGTCVASGHGASWCDAAHIPHSKGSKYFTRLHQHRHLIQPMDDINDVRNGILLSPELHRALGLSELGFSRTPNFAMEASDVGLPNTAVDSANNPASAPVSRTTLHYFMHDYQNFAKIKGILHNSDARLLDSDETPTAPVLDYAYGCAVLKKWGLPEFKRFVEQVTKDILYDDADNNNNDNNNEQKAQETAARRSRMSKKNDMRVILAGFQLANVERMMPQAHAKRLSLNQEKIQRWLQSVE